MKRFLIILFVLFTLTGAQAFAAEKPTSREGEVELLGKCAGALDAYIKIVNKEEEMKITWAKRSLVQVNGGMNVMYELIDLGEQNYNKTLIKNIFTKGFKEGNKKAIQVMKNDEIESYETEAYYLVQTCLEISQDYVSKSLDTVYNR